MSLDVTLTIPGATRPVVERIFIREGGQKKELTRDEWNARFPDREPFTVQETETDTVYDANITHNLGKMADAAGIYEYLWQPDEIGVTKAAQLIEPLREGLRLLRSDPSRFKEYNPSNGWGDYDGFVNFVAEYLSACEANPEAEVKVST